MLKMLIALAILAQPVLAAPPPFEDRAFPSKVFGQQRHYRLFLPADYHEGSRHFPVIYYFHGHSDRYTLERYDEGKDTVPKIARFVASNPVIVVAVDGYVAEDYQGFYGGSPWDVREHGGKYDFGAHFEELTAHIDSTLRTLPGRRHRATSGLSMGGYMSLYLSARHPELIGSASAFNPGPEFYAGEAGRRVLWRPKDHVLNHTSTMVRLIRASGDYISQYHEETRRAYAREERVAFEFRQDEYHRHWATSMEETFAFHMRAFETAALATPPEVFHHDNAHADFTIWDWRFSRRGGAAGYTVVRDVSQSGLRIETRRWAPDGPPVAGSTVAVTTPARYQPGAAYIIIDAPLDTGDARRFTVKAGAEGRLQFDVAGTGRLVSITGPGASTQQPVLLPVSHAEGLRVLPGQDISLPIRIYNPRTELMKDVRIALRSAYPEVEVKAGEVVIPEIPAGGRVDLSSSFNARFTAAGGDYRTARIDVSLSAGWPGATDKFDALIAPAAIAEPVEMVILDGRTHTFPVFRQRGNQGGGASYERTVTEGNGNGNGILEPGEEATVWVKIPQGLDPFDKNNWRRVRVFADSPWIEEVERIEEIKEREFTGAKDLTSVIRLSNGAPAAAPLPAVLRTETWSFHYTPDVRFGPERLYQAFQLHQGHVFRADLSRAGK
ncbi:MAG: hypothetical protein KJZ84_10390 [Bryobacteraceae bacterium]|nr:hypothetical protein [Bryobacteraceae bacterium]